MNLYVRADVLIVAVFLGPTGAVALGIAIRLMGYVRQATIGLVNGLDATFSNLGGQRRRIKNQGTKTDSIELRLLSLSTSLQGGVVFQLGVLLFLLRQEIVHLWVGDVLVQSTAADMVNDISLLTGLMIIGISFRSLNLGWMSSIFIKTLEHILQRPYHLAIDKTGYIVSWSSENNFYLYGSSLVSFVVAPIPRVLWDDKPSVRVGPWIAEQIYNRENRSGVPPGLVAELFLNFSWLGIFIGMFLYGSLCRLIYNSHISFDHSGNGWRVFYAIFLISLIFRLLGADFSGAVIFFLRLFFPFLLITLFSNLSSAKN